MGLNVSRAKIFLLFIVKFKKLGFNAPLILNSKLGSHFEMCMRYAQILSKDESMESSIYLNQ